MQQNSNLSNRAQATGTTSTGVNKPSAYEQQLNQVNALFNQKEQELR